MGLGNNPEACVFVQSYFEPISLIHIIAYGFIIWIHFGSTMINFTKREYPGLGPGLELDCWTSVVGRRASRLCITKTRGGFARNNVMASSCAMKSQRVPLRYPRHRRKEPHPTAGVANSLRRSSLVRFS